ncbi:hypothetical protein T08_3146 [Trichinella sp. T8]|nr:hypothetical protein T08_3146 [Trichinella sp. T8]
MSKKFSVPKFNHPGFVPTEFQMCCFTVMYYFFIF